MAGIFAIATRTDFDRSQRTAADLLQKMTLYPWQESRSVTVPESRLVMGAVIQSNACLESAGYLHQEDAVSCAVDGYFVRTLEDCGADSLIRAGRYAEAAIAAYRKFGPDFITRMEGAFAVILHDAKTNRLVAGNGHLANPHIYWHSRDGESIYCTQLGPMAGCRFFEPEVNDRAVGHLLTDGAFFGDETFFQGVRALELASIVQHSLDDDARSSRVYWTFGRGVEPEREKPFRKHLTELCDVLTAAGQRITSRKGRYVAGLSGGLDSRLVAAVAVRSRPEMKTWTFGAPDSPDMIVAKQISDALGVEHLTWPTRPELVPQYAREYARTVDGSISSDFAYGLERTRGLMEHADIVLNGLAGEVILGDYLVGPNPKLLKTQLKELPASRWFSPNRVLGREMTDRQVARFMSFKAGKPSSLAPYLAHRPRSTFERILEELESLSPQVHPAHRREHLMMTNRVTRWTIQGILSDRHFYSDGSLFYDYEVIDRCMAAPQQMREGNRLYAAVFGTLLPEVAGIPNANNGLRADVSPGRAFAGKLVKMVRERWNPVTVSNPATGNHPDGWARNLYPDYYRDLLADRRTRERPFWDGPAIADLFEKHVAGEVNIGSALGQLASVEYFFRDWVD